MTTTPRQFRKRPADIEHVTFVKGLVDKFVDENSEALAKEDKKKLFRILGYQAEWDQTHADLTAPDQPKEAKPSKSEALAETGATASTDAAKSETGGGRNRAASR